MAEREAAKLTIQEGEQAIFLARAREAGITGAALSEISSVVWNYAEQIQNMRWIILAQHFTEGVVPQQLYRRAHYGFAVLREATRRYAEHRGQKVNVEAAEVADTVVHQDVTLRSLFGQGIKQLFEQVNVQTPLAAWNQVKAALDTLYPELPQEK